MTSFEIPPQPENLSPEQQEAKVQPLEEGNVETSAEYPEQGKMTAEQEQELKEAIDEALQNGEQPTLSKREGTAFYPPEEKKSEKSGKLGKMARAAATFLGLTAGSLGLLGKGAHAQEKGKDKDVVKKEATVKEAAPLPEKKMREWNAYVKYLEKIGLKGDKSLDNYETSVKTFNQWRESVKAETHEYPSLTYDDMGEVQEELVDVKKYVNDKIRAHHAAYIYDANKKPIWDTIKFSKKDIMAKDPQGRVIAGSNTTNTIFPLGDPEYKPKREIYIDKITHEKREIEVLDDTAKNHVHKEKEVIQVPPEYRK